MNLISQFFRNRKLKKQYKELRNTVRNVLATDDDILSPEEKEKYRSILEQIEATGRTDARGIEILEKKLDHVMDRKSFSFVLHGWMDVLAVALTVAFGIRGLFLQPFQIPTSSMQPTLFGIHYMDANESRDNTGLLTRICRPLGASKATLIAPEAGLLREGSLPFTRSILSVMLSLPDPRNCYFSGSRVVIGSQYCTLPGEDVQNSIYRYLDRNPANRYYAEGDTVFDGWLSSGDHLFVDRFSIHLMPLKRGEIFIFNTEGLLYRNAPIPGYYYIKRVAGIGGDTLKITDGVLWIRPKGETDFQRADEFSDSFRKIYSGKGGYQGHAPIGLLANGAEFTVPENCYFALGDNTNNSLDSRFWGVVPHRNVIGRPLNVFWPVSRRWGLIDRLAPVDCPTVFPEHSTQPTAMRRQ